ncbi:MAG: ribosome silencing factor [Verrucomicrobia bacterium]|nr:ribosome silencing factor [Verrucomicrobiota bacterium]
MAKKASTKKAAKKATKKAAKKTAAPVPTSEGELLARAAADYADTKKAEDIVILDARGISPITDYFVICTVSSLPQLRAVRNEVWEKLIEHHGIRPLVRDDNFESMWLILHYGDVMVHIFLKEKREFYALEDLWNDAPRVKWSPPGPPAAAKKKVARKAVKK